MNSAGETIISAFSYKETLKCTIKMTCSDGKILPILFFFCLNFELCYSACARAEYEIDGYCCLMCGAGNHVYRDCTEYTSTTCSPCPNSTFLDVPNGRTACFDCMICDPDEGLRVKTACTRTSDAVCEPLQEHYCTEQHRGSCIHALKHTKCRPGEFILQIGTADRDAVCEKCGDGTFSDGSLQTCQPHSKCEDQGLREVKPGTAYSDTVCGNKPPVILIIVILISVIIILALAAAAFVAAIYRSSDLNTPPRRPEETSEQDGTTPQDYARDTADFLSVLKSIGASRGSAEPNSHAGRISLAPPTQRSPPVHMSQY